MQSKKLFDCSDEEIKNVLSAAFTIAFADTSKKVDQHLSDELGYLLDRLPARLKRLFPSVRLNELPIAIENGTCKEYGEYYGLNVAEIVRFVRAYTESTARVNTAKVFLKPVEEEKPAPPADKIFNLYKHNLIEAFEKMKVGGSFEVNGPGLYDFCDAIKIVSFTTAEKYDILAEAAQAVIRDQQLKLSVLVEDFQRKPHKRIIEAINESVEHQKPLPNDVATLVIMKSKYLSLKAYLQSVEVDEINLAELVENKKDFYIQNSLNK